MIAPTIPARPGEDARLRPLPLRRMAWATWWQHRAALGAVAAFLGAVAVYLWLTGLQMHHAEATYCHPASSIACSISFHRQIRRDRDPGQHRLAGGAGADRGVHRGRRCWARELETGTFQYAWTQGIGLLRLTVGKLVPLAVAVTAAAGALTVLFAWYNQPWAAAGDVTPFSPLRVRLARVSRSPPGPWPPSRSASWPGWLSAGSLMCYRRHPGRLRRARVRYRPVAARALHHTAGHQ